MSYGTKSRPNNTKIGTYIMNVFFVYYYEYNITNLIRNEIINKINILFSEFLIPHIYILFEKNEFAHCSLTMTFFPKTANNNKINILGTFIFFSNTIFKLLLLFV